MAGMIEGTNSSKYLIGFSSLKGGEFLVEEIRRMTSPEKTNWSINSDYHFGGYGKATLELGNFMKEVNEKYQLPLDIVYNSKMFYGIMDLMKKDYFKRGSNLLVLHTGGLQGNSIGIT